ncbi:MAG: M48 family metalloprotease [Phycisphaera sp.]|nr:M48 family metalloprotease [Phycisphaera sp.]
MMAMAFAMAMFAGCSTNTYTGRSQLVLLSDSQANAMGVQSYQQILGEAKISQDPRETEPVLRVAKRIAAAADEMMRANGDKTFQWEFNVIKDDNTPNAFCLPGGKVAVYTGIFRAAENETGLAAVVGHEVAHAMARHGSERVSQGMVAQIGAMALGATLALTETSAETQQAAMTAFGAGAQYGVLLPYSRSHESDADKLGLEIAARAGYDPREGPHVWERMVKLYGDGPPKWLSTHPTPTSRIENLEKLAPQYMKYYNAAEKAPHATDKLPPIQPGKTDAPPAGTGAGAATAFSGGMAPSSIDVRGTGFRVLQRQGAGVAQVLEFAFQAGAPCFVYSAQVDGPGGFRQSWDGGASVLPGSNAVLHFDYSRDGRTPPPRGTYTLTVRGSQSGHPFERSMRYSL